MWNGHFSVVSKKNILTVEFSTEISLKHVMNLRSNEIHHDSSYFQWLVQLFEEDMQLLFFFFFKGTFRSPPTSGASRVEDVAFDIDVWKFNFVQQMATQYKYLKTPSEMWQELMKLLCSNTPTCFHLVCGDVSLYYKLIFQNNHVLAALRCLYS